VPGLDDVRRLCLELPGTTWEDRPQARARVADKGFCWTWLERFEEHKARVPNSTVLVVWVASEDVKHGLVEARPDVFFTERHYDGYRAVMVRLDEVDSDELRDLVTEAWRLRAPKRLIAEFDRRQASI
jgi:hypothetical protein